MSQGFSKRSDWYVMLFPLARGPEVLQPLLDEVLPLSGGEPFPDPHVTIAYLAGRAEPRAVLERLDRVSGPDVTIRTGRLFSFSDEPNPVHGFMLAADVPHDETLRQWHVAVVDAVEPLGLLPVFGWAETRTHLHIVRRLKHPPEEVLTRLAQPVPSVTFAAARLVASYRAGDQFVEVLDRLIEAR